MDKQLEKIIEYSKKYPEEEIIGAMYDGVEVWPVFKGDKSVEFFFDRLKKIRQYDPLIDNVAYDVFPTIEEAVEYWGNPNVNSGDFASLVWEPGRPWKAEL